MKFYVALLKFGHSVCILSCAAAVVCLLAATTLRFSLKGGSFAKKFQLKISFLKSSSSFCRRIQWLKVFPLQPCHYSRLLIIFNVQI